MADWNSLKPLKIHIAILVVLAIILGTMLYFSPKRASRSNSRNSYTQEDIRGTYTVTASGGLSIRNQPDKDGGLIVVAPYHAKLTVIDTEVAQDYINGKNGYWYKVKYQGTIGYAWGNYLKR